MSAPQAEGWPHPSKLRRGRDGPHPSKLRSLWDMLQSYFPIYQLALKLQRLRETADTFNRFGYSSSEKIDETHTDDFNALLNEIHERCLEYGFAYTADMTKRILDVFPPKSYGGMLAHIDHLIGSLGHELQKEAVFRVPPERKGYYEQQDLLGPAVAAAFPSCERDIRKAGTCYALGEEDACVHHLMLVLERGLYALAVKLSVPHHRSNWQFIIDQVGGKLKSLSRSPELDFYREINSQFGFLKDAYRNHSEHTRDDPYDMEKALSIFNHVKQFMQEAAKGGLSE